MLSGTAFQGPRPKLVLAFDVGTTYSGISYSILDPGQVPEIKGVTKFPGLEYVSGSSKIPTIIYYDRKGQVRAVGAEATREGIFEEAEEEQWSKAEWFKLHLRSKFGGGQHITEVIPPLPLNKSVVEVFADFLKYLFDCASSYIKATHINGADLWKSVVRRIDFVLPHPNGWEGAEQSQMRKAAVLAGLITDDVRGHARLSFVTEGEASFHFSLHNGLPDGALKKGEGVIIVDAGGGTIDVSSYSKNIRASEVTFEEIAAPQSYFNGSVFVGIHAQAFLQNYLADSPFASDIDHIVTCFDKTTKLKFKDAEETQYVKFGSTRDNDPNCNIRFGQLKITGSDVALFFKPSVDCIVKAVLEQRKIAHKPVSHVVLVGGFAASHWLHSKVETALASSGLNVLVPENHVNKAVSDGAVSFYLYHLVRTRIPKFTYGCFIAFPFNPTESDHQQRAAKSFFWPDGIKRIVHFDAVLPKNTQVSETKEFKRAYLKVEGTRDRFKGSTQSVWCYRGNIANPKWKDVDPQNYTKVCDIMFDLSDSPLVRRVNNETRKSYYELDYEIVLLFGFSEFKAQVAWKENGVEKRSPAKIIYEPDNTEE